MLISRAVAKPKLPTPPETIGRLMTASGDVSADTANALQKASPTLEAAKAAGNYPKNLQEAPKLFNDASQGIENQISQMAKQKAGMNVSQVTQKMADAVRDELNNFPKDAAGNVLAKKSVIKAINELADKTEKVTTLDDLDKLRGTLNGELQTYMKKNNFDQAAILRDPAKGFKARALEQVRDHIADALSNPVYGASDIRNLRAQQAGLMNLSQTFKDRAGEAAAQDLSQSTLPDGKKLIQTAAKGAEAVMHPRQAALAALMSPTSSDSLVNSAFAPKTNLRPSVPSVIGSMMTSMQKTKEPESRK